MLNVLNILLGDNGALKGAKEASRQGMETDMDWQISKGKFINLVSQSLEKRLINL